MRWLTVRQVAQDFGLAESSIRSKLSRYQHLFVAKYRRAGRHPRLVRALTEMDVRMLTALVISTRPWRTRG